MKDQRLKNELHLGKVLFLVSAQREVPPDGSWLQFRIWIKFIFQALGQVGFIEFLFLLFTSPPISVLNFHVALSLQNEVELGELLLSLNYLPSAGRLNVDVIRAKQLLQTDMSQGSGKGQCISHITLAQVVCALKQISDEAAICGGPGGFGCSVPINTTLWICILYI